MFKLLCLHESFVLILVGSSGVLRFSLPASRGQSPAGVLAGPSTLLTFTPLPFYPHKGVWIFHNPLLLI